MNLANQTLEHIVTVNPRAADVFARHGLDFCCHGRRPLGEACREAGLDVHAVVAELAAEDGEERACENWSGRSLSELIDHILERYHRPLRRDIPALIELARRIERTHAGKPMCPAGLAEHLERMQTAVESHLAKEERILFPLIRAGRGEMAYMPIRVMMQEHEDHGENLRRARELAHDLVTPREACASWRELYRGLARLESELWKHIHLENYVLFPRALERVGAGAGRA